MIDTRVLSLARHVLHAIRKHEAAYEADVKHWYEHGDGRPTSEGGRGHLYPYCIHGAYLWVDHDIPCGVCEMDQGRATWRAVHEAAFAVRESDLRVQWLASRPTVPGQPHRLVELPSVPGIGGVDVMLAEWAFAPIADLMVPELCQ